MLPYLGAVRHRLAECLEHRLRVDRISASVRRWQLKQGHAGGARRASRSTSRRSAAIVAARSGCSVSSARSLTHWRISAEGPGYRSERRAMCSARAWIQRTSTQTNVVDSTTSAPADVASIEFVLRGRPSRLVARDGVSEDPSRWGHPLLDLTHWSSSHEGFRSSRRQSSTTRKAMPRCWRGFKSCVCMTWTAMNTGRVRTSRGCPTDVVAGQGGSMITVLRTARTRRTHRGC